MPLLFLVGEPSVSCLGGRPRFFGVGGSGLSGLLEGPTNTSSSDEDEEASFNFVRTLCLLRGLRFAAAAASLTGVGSSLFLRPLACDAGLVDLATTSSSELISACAAFFAFLPVPEAGFFASMAASCPFDGRPRDFLTVDARRFVFFFGEGFETVLELAGSSSEASASSRAASF